MPQSIPVFFNACPRATGAHVASCVRIWLSRGHPHVHPMKCLRIKSQSLCMTVSRSIHGAGMSALGRVVSPTHVGKNDSSEPILRIFGKTAIDGIAAIWAAHFLDYVTFKHLGHLLKSSQGQGWPTPQRWRLSTILAIPAVAS